MEKMLLGLALAIVLIIALPIAYFYTQGKFEFEGVDLPEGAKEPIFSIAYENCYEGTGGEGNYKSTVEICVSGLKRSTHSISASGILLTTGVSIKGSCHK